MIYLRKNPLLREPLSPEDTKIRLLGHWGSDPGMSFIYVHLNRLIRKYDLNMIFLAGPGHGAPAILSNAYLEGTYSEIYPENSEDERGLCHFFRQFSFPGGIGSHCTPETPGSIHEGGELGYSVSHAFGSVLDHPDLISVVMVGDGEAETGPLATAWHSNKFLNPIRDGAVLPVLHLNGYKINNPTILARISHEELEHLFRGYGYEPYFVEGSQRDSMHQAVAATLEHCIQQIRAIQEEARRTGVAKRPRWPVTDRDFDSLFTTDKPIIFNFHAYPWLIHRMAYRRKNHDNLHVRGYHVRGYKEKGNINTPLGLAIQNQVDRFSIAIDVIDRVPRLRNTGAHAKESFKDQQIQCREYAYRNGVDKPEIVNWKWPD